MNLLSWNHVLVCDLADAGVHVQGPCCGPIDSGGYAGELRPEDRRDARTDAQTPTNVSGSPVHGEIHNTLKF
jgi:hypothetical protein